MLQKQWPPLLLWVELAGQLQQWRRQRQHDSGCIFVTLIVYLITFLSKGFSFNDSFGGQGRDGTDKQTDGQTDKRTDIWTDRLFSENIILDMGNQDLQVIKCQKQTLFQ